MRPTATKVFAFLVSAALIVSSSATSEPASAFDAAEFRGYYYWGNGTVSSSMQTTMASPLVGGLSFFSTWKDMEPSHGSYQWAALDSWAAASRSLSKPLLVRIKFGNTNELPSWLFGPHGGAGPAEKFEWDGKYIPVFWDPVMKRDWGAFVKALGARYANHPKLVVMVTGPWEAHGEPFMPCVTTEQKDRWTSQYQRFTADPSASFATVQDAYDDFALEYLAPLFAASFPSAPLAMATGRLMCDKPTTRDHLTKQMLTLRNRYGGFTGTTSGRGFFFQNNALRTPSYPVTTWLGKSFNPVDGTLHKGVIGYQPHGCVVSLCSYGVAMSADEFVTAIDLAVSYHASYVELQRAVIEAGVNPGKYAAGTPQRAAAEKVREVLERNQASLAVTSAS